VRRLAEVRLQEGESLENALRRFKRKVQQEDIIKEVKRHSSYLKPGEKRRVKEALARKRAQKKSRKESDNLQVWGRCCQAAVFRFAGQRSLLDNRSTSFGRLSFTAVPSSAHCRQTNLRETGSSVPKLHLPCSRRDLPC
jgi:small subunit ribosomal protein S21